MATLTLKFIQNFASWIIPFERFRDSRNNKAATDIAEAPWLKIPPVGTNNCFKLKKNCDELFYEYKIQLFCLKSIYRSE